MSGKRGRFELKEGEKIPKTSADFQKLIGEGKVSFKVKKAISRFNTQREVSEFLEKNIKAEIKAKSGSFGSHQSKYVIAVIQALNSFGFMCDVEHVFDTKRKFRFDIVILPIENKIAIEYEGIFSEKSRHTHYSGFPKDCEKYRIATLKGWRVLRYTAACLKGRNGEYRVVEDVKKLINNN